MDDLLEKRRLKTLQKSFKELSSFYLIEWVMQGGENYPIILKSLEFWHESEAAETQITRKRYALSNSNKSTFFAIKSLVFNNLLSKSGLKYMLKSCGVFFSTPTLFDPPLNKIFESLSHHHIGHKTIIAVLDTLDLCKRECGKVIYLFGIGSTGESLLGLCIHGLPFDIPNAMSAIKVYQMTLLVGERRGLGVMGVYAASIHVKPPSV
ncbi:hypothetical protein NQ317_002808 [Molorchus minor]|uniref:Uncharacterized protein n=1 Tax=Molorchus minor TaxID=1323400 RepID=A0ABQ9JPH8_9CUCU|nr:hypothetical protein NQ317_002808 [Molorchus minor]